MMSGKSIIQSIRKLPSNRIIPPKRLRSVAAYPIKESNFGDANSSEWNFARPYEEIPGPRPVPLFGNLVKFLPRIGKDAIIRQTIII